MAKKGMKRPDNKHNHTKDNPFPVPEIQGKAKHGKTDANPIIAGTTSPAQKVWHGKSYSVEDPISSAYPVIDTDLARDNIENDIPSADLRDI